MTALDSFGFRNRSAQPDSQIVREVIPADWDRAGVAHYAAAKNDQFGGSAADIEEAATKLALILREARFCGSKRLKNGVANEDAGFGGGGLHGYRALEGSFLGGCLFSGRVAGRAAAAAVA